MARLLPVLPVLRPGWKLQPVHAADVGKAIALAALDPNTHAGRTYELGGPNVMTMAELNRWVCETIGRQRRASPNCPIRSARPSPASPAGCPARRSPGISG